MQWVYFFRKPSTGLIKVGCTGYVKGRLSHLSRQEGEALEFLAAFEGDFLVEEGLHTHFSDSRVRGEWFKETDELLSVVEAARRRTENSLISEEHLDRDLLALGQAASLAGVPKQAVEALLEEERIPVYRTPLGHRRFAREDIEKNLEWLEAHLTPEITFP